MTEFSNYEKSLMEVERISNITDTSKLESELAVFMYGDPDSRAVSKAVTIIDIPTNILLNFHELFHGPHVATHQRINLDIISKFSLRPYMVGSNPYITYDEYKEIYPNKAHIKNWIKHHDITHAIIQDNIDYIDFSSLVCTHKMPWDIIYEFKSKFNIIDILKYQSLTESNIKHLLVDNNGDMREAWVSVSKNQRLSEEFMTEYAGLLNWVNLTRYQTMSPEFISNYSDKVAWYYINVSIITPRWFIDSYKYCINWNRLILEHKRDGKSVDWMDAYKHLCKIQPCGNATVRKEKKLKYKVINRLL